MFDVLSDILEPYHEHLAKFAGSVTTLQFLSAIFLLNDIRKDGLSDTYPPEPFVGGFVLSLLSLRLGAIMNNPALTNTNLIGLAISTVFFAVFYYYASPEFRKKIWQKVGYAAAFTAVCLAYSCIESTENIEFRFGMLITGILVFLVGSPLLSLNKIIERKTTEGLPFPLILSGTIVAASWMLYGISIRNSVVTYQNLLLFSMSAVQLSLFAIYPSKPAAGTKAAAKKEN